MLSLYRASVPVFVRGFENLSAILVIAHDHALALATNTDFLKGILVQSGSHRQRPC